MKKHIVLLICSFCLLTSVIKMSVLADPLVIFNAVQVDYPIIVNSVRKTFDDPIVSINDKTYLPLRSLCDALDIKISWNEADRTVEVLSDVVYKGYDGIKEWEQLDLCITKESAITIADAIFLQYMGEDFVNSTIIDAIETKDKKYFSVYRADPHVEEGGSISIVIRKSDGKVMRIVSGE